MRELRSNGCWRRGSAARRRFAARSPTRRRSPKRGRAATSCSRSTGRPTSSCASSRALGRRDRGRLLHAVGARPGAGRGLLRAAIARARGRASGTSGSSPTPTTAPGGSTSASASAGLVPHEMVRRPRLSGQSSRRPPAKSTRRAGSARRRRPRPPHVPRVGVSGATAKARSEHQSVPCVVELDELVGGERAAQPPPQLGLDRAGDALEHRRSCGRCGLEPAQAARPTDRWRSRTARSAGYPALRRVTPSADPPPRRRAPPP